MTTRAMCVAPAVVGRQEPCQQSEQVGIAPGAEFYDRQPRRRMRNEDVEQAIAALTCVSRESSASGRDVGDRLTARGAEPESHRLHAGRSRLGSLDTTTS